MNYEPASHERVYYRHAMTGDLGYLVERDGQQYVRLDRPAEVVERRYDSGDWQPVHDYRPLTTMQASMVAFEADKKLCFLLQDHKGAKRDYAKLKDQERIDWMNTGPKGHSARKLMFTAIMKSLRSVAG